MPKWSITNKGNIVQCKSDCKLNHEHYIGTYEMAVKYFGIDQSKINNYGKLINIIFYHQTSQYTVRKFSNELYDLLIKSMSEHKYWIEPKYREKKAFETLNEANKIGLIMDKTIEKSITDKYSENYNQQRRLYLYKIWYEQNVDKLNY